MTNKDSSAWFFFPPLAFIKTLHKATDFTGQAVCFYSECLQHNTGRKHGFIQGPGEHGRRSEATRLFVGPRSSDSGSTKEQTEEEKETPRRVLCDERPVRQRSSRRQRRVRLIAENVEGHAHVFRNLLSLSRTRRDPDRSVSVGVTDEQNSSEEINQPRVYPAGITCPAAAAQEQLLGQQGNKDRRNVLTLYKKVFLNLCC